MTDFTMPSLGADMESGKFVEWQVKAGDVVSRGDVVCVIETQKGAVDVEIWDSGTITELVARPGDVIPVGGVMARLDAAGGSAGAAPGETVAPPDEPVASRGAPAPRASPGIPRSEPAGSPARPSGESREPSVAVSRAAAVPPAPAPGARAMVTPAARRRAAALGVDPDRLAGTGTDGAVTLADVERAGGSSPGPTPPEAPPRSGAPATGAAAMREAIAAAMSRSKREIPHYYLGTGMRVDRAVAWLTERNASRPVTERVLFAALAIKAVAVALREAPYLNGHHVDGVFRPSAAIHVGVAISMRGGGLVAPAIHDTDRLGLDALMAKLRDVIQRARTGQLRSSEITGPTITVTSLGDLGVESVYGVIYPPQVAIVGLGRVLPRPWVADGKVVAAQTLTATLAADHRVSDGMGGARFLSTLDQCLQEPEALQ